MGSTVRPPDAAGLIAARGSPRASSRSVIGPPSIRMPDVSHDVRQFQTSRRQVLERRAVTLRVSARLDDKVVYETGPRRDPWQFGDPAHAGGPAPTDPDLGFLWSGRRDSNPRPPPWQNSAAQMRHQRKLPKMNADVQVRNRSHLVVSCCFPVSCGRSAAWQATARVRSGRAALGSRPEGEPV